MKCNLAPFQVRVESRLFLRENSGAWHENKKDRGEKYVKSPGKKLSHDIIEDTETQKQMLTDHHVHYLPTGVIRSHSREGPAMSYALAVLKVVTMA